MLVKTLNQPNDEKKYFDNQKKNLWLKRKHINVGFSSKQNLEMEAKFVAIDEMDLIRFKGLFKRNAAPS